ncbi:MAG: hypothetical protein KGJ23_14080 [Euryarchaeota archaeon]|nr:hypothetical protein [Euryarchaeota archaeon]MDE1837727.1 hypothetical protein [Euryarchaeota archaeon]MDE1880947.1 hypothetical protein [Euryarchaeota archaeon]MDE2046110.1 hypothetical protein [Thermoplasmata archaeon]
MTAVSASAHAFPERGLLRGWAPLRRGDPPSLLERGATYLPFERELRGRWEDWRQQYHRTPIGRAIPLDLVAVLREAPAPSGLFRAVGRRPTFRAYPLPARPVEGPWVVIEDPRERPKEGRCYRVRRPVRRSFTFREPAGHGFATEEVLWADEVERIPESEFYPSLHLSTSEAQVGLRAFCEETGLSERLASLLLLPYVGAPPWHGRASGVDVVLGSWGVPSSVVAPVVAPLRSLLPPWEVALERVRGRRSRGSEEASYSKPYSVAIDPMGVRAWDRLLGKGPGYETSFLLYGGSDGADLLRVLFDAHVPLLDRADRWQELAATRVDPDLFGAWSDRLVRSHFRDPQMPEDEELHREIETALATVRRALVELPAQLNLPKSEFEGFLLRGSGLRDHLVQAALAHARVLGRGNVGGGDLSAIADQYVEALADPELGSAKASRELLSRGARVRSKRELSRYFVLRSVLMERPDLPAAELWQSLRRKDLWSSEAALEEYLHRLYEQGVLASMRAGTYRWEGL